MKAEGAFASSLTSHVFRSCGVQENIWFLQTMAHTLYDKDVYLKLCYCST
jgi:hypothetical protein